jgi:hypothetical protein
MKKPRVRRERVVGERGRRPLAPEPSAMTGHDTEPPIGAESRYVPVGDTSGLAGGGPGGRTGGMAGEADTGENGGGGGAR